jgi:hypothetical protein
LRVASAADRVISLFDGMVVDDAPMTAQRHPTPLPDVLKLRG